MTRVQAAWENLFLKKQLVVDRRYVLKDSARSRGVMIRTYLGRNESYCELLFSVDGHSVSNRVCDLVRILREVT